MKKLISMFLVACFLFSCNVITASAKTSDADINKENLNPIEISQNALDIVGSTKETKDFVDREYINVKSDFETHYLDTDEVTFNLNLSSLNEYDYTKTYFSSTENIILANYLPKEYVYSDGLSNFNISFDVNKNAIPQTPILNFQEATFEKIYIITNAYVGTDVVDTRTIELAVLPTEQGAFLSRYGDVYAYDSYISYMYSNALITDEEYNFATRKATELTKIDEANTTLDTISYQKLKVYNEENENVELKTLYNPVNILGISNVTDMEVPLRSTSTSGTIAAPEILVSRTIDVLDSGERLRVYGCVEWTDIEGDWHPARNIEVKIMDANNILDLAKATVYTNNSGYFTATIDNQTGILENGLDIYIRVNTANDDFQIANNVVNSIFTAGYYFTTEPTKDVTNSQSIEFYHGNDTNIIRSLSVHQALVAGYHYYETMNNDNVNDIEVIYPGMLDENGEDGSWSDSLWDYINIEYDDYCDWDTILHELGHQVATKISVDTPFDEEHSFMENLYERYGKTLGVAGGWGEGWATYFSIAAQIYYNNVVATISSIPNVADYIYTDITLEGNGIISGKYSYNIANYSGHTDGDQMSVASVLLNLFLDGSIGLTHQQIWNIAKQSQCDKFSDFLYTLYNNVNKSLHTKIGKHLEKQNISDKPIFSTSIFKRSESGIFKWTAADVTDDYDGDEYNNHVYYNQLKLTFYDKQFNIVFQTPYISSSLGTYGTTLTDLQWEVLTSAISTGDPFYWGLATYQNYAPATGPYYSSINKCYFIDDFDVSKIESFNIGYNNNLATYEADFFEFTAPETGNYAFYSEGNTDVRLTYYLSDEFIANDISDDDSGVGLNFLYEAYITANSTVYLKVDGHESASGSYKIAVAKITTITINESRSQNLVGVTGIWYKFTAPYSATYTFLTLSAEDTYGDLFYYPTVDGSMSNSLTYNDDYGASYDFKITYEISKGQTVYLRVRGYDEVYQGQFILACYYTLLDFNIPQEIYLYSGQYVAYEFVAPFDGEYTFYTEGDVDTFAEVFNQPVYDKTSTFGRIKYDDDGGEDSNCAVTCSLSAGQIVYIRITNNVSSTRIFSVVVSKKNFIDTDTVYDDSIIAGKGNWYIFTAPFNGMYRFYTIGSTDTYGYLFNSYTDDYESDYLMRDDDNGDGMNFSIFYRIASGQKIYIYVRGSNAYTEGAYSIVAECEEIE